MSVNVMNGLHEKCQSVNQASFLECEPTEVFLHGCHTRVSVPVLVNISCAFILDGFECLDSGKLMRVPHDAAIFHGSYTVFCPGFQKGRVPSEKGTLER